MIKISAVIIAKNEEKKIKKCLDSVSWVDEIVVVDDGSEDKTAALAKKYTTKVFSHKSDGFVEAARNFALSKATGDWVLLLDADEIIPETLAEKLKDISRDEDIEYCKIPRKNIIFGQWIQNNKGWWPDYQLRFFRKGKVTWPEQIHSQPDVLGEGIDLPAEERYAIHHLNYETISQFIEKLDRYTTQEAIEKGENPKWEDAYLLPVDEFVSRFFAREGYKDGMHGVVLSMLEAFYAEVLFAKRWEKGGFYKVDQASFLKRNVEIMKKAALQMEYWQVSSLMNDSKNPLNKIKLSLKRRGITKRLSKIK